MSSLYEQASSESKGFGEPAPRSAFRRKRVKEEAGCTEEERERETQTGASEIEEQAREDALLGKGRGIRSIYRTKVGQLSRQTSTQYNTHLSNHFNASSIINLTDWLVRRRGRLTRKTRHPEVLRTIGHLPSEVSKWLFLRQSGNGEAPGSTGRWVQLPPLVDVPAR